MKLTFSPWAPALLYMALICHLSTNAIAATSRHWTGSVSANWSDPNNWNPTGAPRLGDQLYFGYVSDSNRSMTNDMTGVTISGLFFVDRDYQLSGNALTVWQYLEVDNDFTTDSHTTTINCPLIILSPSPGYVTAQTALSTYGQVTESTADLHLNGPIVLTNDLVLEAFATNNGAGGNGHIYVSGQVSGPGNLIVYAHEVGGHVSPVEFDGSQGNTFSGSVLLTTFGNGQIVFNKSSGYVATNRVQVGVDYATTAKTANLNLAGNNQIDPNATLAVFRGGQLSLSGNNLTVGGLLLASSSNAAETNAAILDTGTTTVGLNGGIISSNDSTLVTPTIKGRLNLNGPLTFTVSGLAYAGLDMQATLGSAGGILKYGNSALLLEASNTFSGGVTIYEGSVDVRNNFALGAGPYNRLSGGSMTLRNVSIAQQALYAEGQSIAGDLPGSLLTTIGSNYWAGPIILDTNLDIAGDITINAQIFGSGGLGFFGGGTSMLTGSYSNLYTGTTLVRCPLLELNKPINIPAVAGPLVVGGGSGGPSEARWLNSYQGSFSAMPLTLYANGIINVNNYFEVCGTVTFNGGEIDTGTGHLVFTQPITVNPSSATAVINGRLDVGSDPAYFHVGDGAADPDLLVNAILEAGNETIYKDGPGTLALTAPNTYNGTTYINAGVLQADDPNALGGTGQGTVVSAGATLRFDGIETIAEPLTISGTGAGGTQGALEVVNNGDSATLTAPLQLSRPATINLGAGAGMSINTVISGTGPLTLAGSGILSLGGAGNNTYSGDTIVAGGALFLSKGNNVLSVPGNLVIGPVPAGPQAITRFFQFGAMGGTVATVNANSIFDLNGYAQALTQLNLNDGGSVVTGTGLLGLAAGASVSVGSLSHSGSHVGSSISGNISLPDGATSTFHVSPYAVFPPFASGPELDVPAVISGTTSQFANYLAKDGLGQMRLSGNNTFPEPIIINGGPLIASSSSALGTGAGGVFVNNNGSLALDGGVAIANTSLHLNSSNSPALDSRSGSNVWSGPIALTQSAAMNVQTNGYLQLLNSIGGTGGLTKLGPGTLQFWGSTSNSYSGATIVGQGILDAGRVGLTSIPGDAVIGDDTTTTTLATLRCLREQQIKPTANVSVHNSGYFYLYDYPSVPPPHQQLRTLTGGGQVRIDSQALLTISNDVPFTFDGTVNGGGGATVTFIKTGPGTMTFSSKSTANFFGSATLNAGTLRVDGYFPAMGLDVKSGALLRGGGTLNTAIIENGATLGADSPTPDHQGGGFQVSTVQLTNGSTLQLNFFGPAPTGGNDQINSLSGPTISNSTLAAAFFYPPHDGDVLTLMHNGFSGAAKGTFNGWPAGQQKLVGTVPVVISYTGNGVNDVTLTVTNLALAFSSYRLAQGNGNQTVEPDECNLLYVSLTNRRASPITITNAVLRAVTSNTPVTIAQAGYPALAAGSTTESSSAFQFRTDPALTCGTAVTFELVLSTTTEGQFAINFTVPAGSDCTHPTGPCQSCTLVSGQFTSNAPVVAQPLYFVGAPSICYPPKACPGADPGTNLFSFLTHSFTNSMTNDVCLTAQLQFNCPAAPTNALGLAAYLGSFDPAQPCTEYLGDFGQGGPPYPAFSFHVPAGSNFTLVVMDRAANLPCNSYSIELFGLPCPLPTLAISPEATPYAVRVHWSTAYPGWTAQQVGTPVGTFSNVLQQPVIVAGRYSLTNIVAVTNQFYRLKK